MYATENTARSLPAAAPAVAPDARFVALVGQHCLASGDSLAAVLEALDAGPAGADVTLWQGTRLLAIETIEGRLIWLRAVRPD